jgi:hypothetical protein
LSDRGETPLAERDRTVNTVTALTDLQVGMNVVVSRPRANLVISGVIHKVEHETVYNYSTNENEIATSILFKDWGYSTNRLTDEDSVTVIG